MIAYLPEIYPDELMYSWIARYYIYSGYPASAFAIEDMFGSKMLKPDIEFIGSWCAEAKQMISRVYNLHELIEKHTMFPWYGRFIPADRRNNALSALAEGTSHICDILPHPKPKQPGEKRFLRWCPLCVAEDREKYGETYWHRIHQMRDVSICAVHGCLLINSSYQMIGNRSFRLFDAESNITLEERFISFPVDNEKRILDFTRYLSSVFEQPVQMRELNIGNFLLNKMTGGSYISVRGGIIHLTRLYEEISGFYNGLTNRLITSIVIQQLLYGRRWDFYQISQLGYFLNVPPEHMADPPHINSRVAVFDCEARTLRSSGMTRKETAEAMGTSTATILRAERKK